MARILIVEDESLVSMMLEDMLVDLGHDIANVSASVSEALDALKDPPECAILDVSLGEESGYPVADELLKRGIPFAFATGFGKQGVDSRYSDAPVVPKPFDEKNLAAVVGQMMGTA